MAHGFHDVVSNALFAMADLFLDYANGVDLDSQYFNMAEFIIDCFNVDEGTPEFDLLQLKFTEEFRESNDFLELTKAEVTTLLEDATQNLLQKRELPLVIQKSIDAYYKN